MAQLQIPQKEVKRDGQKRPTLDIDNLLSINYQIMKITSFFWYILLIVVVHVLLLIIIVVLVSQHVFNELFQDTSHFLLCCFLDPPWIHLIGENFTIQQLLKVFPGMLERKGLSFWSPLTGQTWEQIELLFLRLLWSYCLRLGDILVSQELLLILNMKTASILTD